MLQLRDIPVQHAGTMTAYLLHNSEKFFPPLNGVCTLSNLILTVTAYLNKDSSREASVKLPYFAASFGLNIATTLWAILIMVPMNKAMARHAASLEANSEDEKSAKELRRLQTRWQKLNYGELDLVCVEMLGNGLLISCCRSRFDHDRFFDHCPFGLLQDSSVLKL